MEKGIYAVNKPVGITSHDVIYALRRITGEKRIGHAGTLDPLASGVLVVAIGREFTKKIDNYKNSDKEYVAEIELGINSTTDDSEGEKTIINQSIKPTVEEVQQVARQFIGKILQTPPAYSAIKVNGQVAYKAARKGKALVLEPREVEIKEIELLEYMYPVIQIKITCEKGVYIRALARDIGEKLKTGGYMKSLIRTRVGEFKLENALTLDKKYYRSSSE